MELIGWLRETALLFCFILLLFFHLLRLHVRSHVHIIVVPSSWSVCVLPAHIARRSARPAARRCLRLDGSCVEMLASVQACGRQGEWAAAWKAADSNRLPAHLDTHPLPRPLARARAPDPSHCTWYLPLLQPTCICLCHHSTIIPPSSKSGTGASRIASVRVALPL